jgi:hypothetical protein
MSKVEDFLTKEDEQEIVEAIRIAEKKHLEKLEFILKKQL